MMIKKRFLVLAGLSLLIAQSLQAAPLQNWILKLLS